MGAEVRILFYCCLGAAAALILAAVLLTAHVARRLKVSSQVGLTSLLDYATAADDSVIVLKNGALMRCYEIFPADLSHADPAYAEHVRSLVSRALLKLGGSFCVQTDIIRLPDTNYLPRMGSDNDTVRVLDKLRRADFSAEKSFKTKFCLTLTYLGNSQTRQTLSALMLKDESAGTDARGRTLQLIESFKERCDAAVATLELCFKVKLLKINAQGEHEALSLIESCLQGRALHVRYPSVPVYLDALLGNADFTTGLTPTIGGRHIAAVAVDGLPSEAYFGMLDELAKLPCSYRFSTRFLSFDDLQSAFLLEKYRRFWTQKSKGILSQIFNLPGRLNANAVAKVAEIDAARQELDAGRETFGCYTAVIILMDEDFEKLQEQADLCVHCLENLGFGARIETLNAVEAFLGSLPGHTKENLRRPLVSQQALCDLLPLSQPWEGERTAPNPMLGPDAGPLMQVRTAGRGRFYLNLHEYDLGHTIVIGPPGAGKSVLLQALMVNFLRYPKARVYAFDKGWSFYALSQTLPGEHIVLESVQSAFCPLADADRPGGLEYAQSFTALLARLSGLTLSPRQRAEITSALQLLQGSGAEERTLTDLYLMLSDPELKQALAQYTLRTNPQAVLDSPHNPDFTQCLTVFECGSVFERSPAFSLPLLKQLFHVIENSFDGSPVMIVVDEAWMMLRDETFAAELLKWFKTLRKHNVLVVLATQSLTDLASSGIFEIFLECAKTRIFLPNFDAGSPVLAPIYQKLGVNQAELTSIIRGTPKQDYLFKKGPDSIVFDLNLTAQERALMSFAGDHCVRQVDAAIAAGGRHFFLKAGPLPAALTASAVKAAAGAPANSPFSMHQAAAAASGGSNEKSA